MGVIDAIKAAVFKPDHFFVIGTGRSGTSLLTGMLDYHSGLQVAFERYAPEYLHGEALSEKKSGCLVERVRSFKKSCELEAVRSPYYWGNKITTEQICALESCTDASWPTYLDFFIRKMIGNKKVVFILRDGRSCVRSKMNRTGKSYKEALDNYKKSVAVLERFRSSRVRLLECHYESLIRDPETELRKVCTFLGVKFEEKMLQGSANKKMLKDYQAPEVRPAEEQDDFPAEWTEDMRQELVKTKYIDDN